MEILCLGSALADITCWPVTPHLLAHQHLCPQTSLVGPGGCAGNLSLGLAALGCRVHLAARLGADPLGVMVAQQLQERGVATGLLQTDPVLSTGVTIVLVDPEGERRFIYTAGANAFLEPEPLLRLDLSRYGIVQVSDLFLLNNLSGAPLSRMLARARAAGCITSLDTVWDPAGRWLSALAPYLPLLDYLFVSEEEARHIFPGLNRPATVAAFRERGAGVVLLKCGADGCLIGFGDQLEWLVPPEISPVDSTGAGDAFVAGFLAAVAEGATIMEAAWTATHFAVHSLSFLGATAGLERHASTAAFLQTCRNQRG